MIGAGSCHGAGAALAETDAMPFATAVHYDVVAFAPYLVVVSRNCLPAEKRPLIRWASQRSSISVE